MRFAFDMPGTLIYYLIVKRILELIKETENRKGRRVRKEKRIRELRAKKRGRKRKYLHVCTHEWRKQDARGLRRKHKDSQREIEEG